MILNHDWVVIQTPLLWAEKVVQKKLPILLHSCLATRARIFQGNSAVLMVDWLVKNNLPDRMHSWLHTMEQHASGEGSHLT
jgi:hypothetical protein